MNGLTECCTVDILGTPNIGAIGYPSSTSMRGWKQEFKNQNKKGLVSEFSVDPRVDKGTNWKGESFLGYRR
ncbi:MAG: hypothetical protein AAF550_02130, partial [Myxococcota bacterium]